MKIWENKQILSIKKEHRTLDIGGSLPIVTMQKNQAATLQYKVGSQGVLQLGGLVPVL